MALPAVGRLIGLPGGWGEFLYHHEPEAYHADLGVAATSTLIAVLGLGIAAAFYSWNIWSPQSLALRWSWLHRLLVNKFFIDDFYQAVIDRVVLAAGEFIALFDRVVVNDTGVNGTGAIPVVAGDKLKYIETGKLPNYALAMAIGVLAAAAAALTFVR